MALGSGMNVLRTPGRVKKLEYEFTELRLWSCESPLELRQFIHRFIHR
jgi:hypothetical protein